MFSEHVEYRVNCSTVATILGPTNQVRLSQPQMQIFFWSQDRQVQTVDCMISSKADKEGHTFQIICLAPDEHNEFDLLRKSILLIHQKGFLLGL